MRYAFIIFFLFLTTATTSFGTRVQAMEAEKSLYAAWVDQITKESKIVDGRLESLELEVKRLEREYKDAQDQIKADKNCVKINCDEIEELAKHIYDALEAANLSVAMTRIGQEELENLAHNMKYATIAQAKGIQAETSKKKLLLLGLEMTQQLAHITAGITVSYLTGDAKGAVDHGQALMKHTYAALVNYTANQGADLVIEHKTALEKLAQDKAGTTGQQTFTNGFIGSVSSQIGNIRIMGVDKTGGYTKTLRSTLVGDNPKATVSQAVQIVTRAVVNAVMEPLVQGKRREIEEAMAAVKRLFSAQRDLYLAAMFGDVVIDMAEERQRKVQDMADRIKKMAHNCNVESRQCLKKWDVAKKAAKQKRDKATAKLKAQNEAAAEELEIVREEWRLTMTEAAQHHEALQRVRDDLVDAERLAANRQKFEDLAKAAPDADKRAQYKAELARLDKLESIDALKSKEKNLEAKRKAAWDKIDALLPAIDQKREAMLAAYNKNQDTIEKSWVVYFKDMRAAHQTFFDCQGTKVSTLPEAPTPTLKELRASLSQEVDPHIIYFALQEKLKTLANISAETNITAHKKNGELCGPEKQAAAPAGGECWRNIGDDPSGDILIEQSGKNIKALVSNSLVEDEGNLDERAINEEAVLSYEGTIKDNELSLEHVYTKADYKFLRGWIAPEVDNKFIEKLIGLKAKSTITGTIGDDPYGGYTESTTGYPHQVMTGTTSLLNYVLESRVGSKCHLKDGKLVYSDDKHCLFESSTPYHQMRFPAQLYHEGDTQWLKLDPIWKHAGSVSLTTQDFQQRIEEEDVKLGSKIWVEVRGDYNCRFRQDEVTVRIEPQNSPQKAFEVILQETSKNSGIYRSSPEGVSLNFDRNEVIDDSKDKYRGDIRFYVPERAEIDKVTSYYPLTITIYEE